MTEARRLEVRCGLKVKDQVRKVYVHMLNGTLCATERALCCVVENYQTPEVGFVDTVVCMLLNISVVGSRCPRSTPPVHAGT